MIHYTAQARIQRDEVNMETTTKNGQNVDMVFKRICEDIEWLHTESEKEMPDGKAARAQILFFALAGFLDEREIIDHLKAAALREQDHRSLVFSRADAVKRRTEPRANAGHPLRTGRFAGRDWPGRFCMDEELRTNGRLSWNRKTEPRPTEVVDLLNVTAHLRVRSCDGIAAHLRGRFFR